MIHAIGIFGNVSEPDAQIPELFIVVWLKKAEASARPVQRLPEFVLAMGVIGLLQRRLPSAAVPQNTSLRPGFSRSGRTCFFAINGCG